MRKMPLSALVVGLALAHQPTAHAQFGSGVVFDPTQSAHAIVQIENGGVTAIGFYSRLPCALRTKTKKPASFGPRGPCLRA